MKIKTLISIIILPIVAFFLISCQAQNRPMTYWPTKQIQGHKANAKKLLVRVTTYWRYGAGTDKWTKRGQSSTGLPLVNKESCAVDPNVIPYGSWVEIPELNLKLKSVDTGSAVKKKTASRRNGRNEPIIDVFFNTKQEALAFNRRNQGKLVSMAIIGQ